MSNNDKVDVMNIDDDGMTTRLHLLQRVAGVRGHAHLVRSLTKGWIRSILYVMPHEAV